MKDHVVVDVEIQRTIEETPGGWNATDQLGVSVAVVYEYNTDRFRVYGPNDVEALRARLLAATRITGFNTFQFDFPVIWGAKWDEWYNDEWLEVRSYLAVKSNDILVRIWRSLGLDEKVFTDKHKGWGLDNVAKATLGVGKSGFGGDAPRWFQAGEWARLTDYCIDDVRIERDLGAFVDRYGFVCNNGRMLRITK